MNRFCIVTFYEAGSTTCLILADGDMTRIAPVEANAILRAYGARVNRDPFRYHDHLMSEYNDGRRIKLSSERANQP